MKKNSPLYVVLFMIIASAVCGAAVSFVHFSMQKTLEANARMSRNRTIGKAFGITVEKKTAAGYDVAIAQSLTQSTVSGNGRRWEVLTRKTAPADIGFIFSGIAFWDRVTGILVLSDELSTIRSIEIIDQKETPGLGARIEETAFKNQFQGFPLNWTQDEQPLTFGKTVDGPDKSHRIDAITGATQTSMALERIINSELTAFRSAYDASLASNGKRDRER